MRLLRWRIAVLWYYYRSVSRGSGEVGKRGMFIRTHENYNYKYKKIAWPW